MALKDNWQDLQDAVVGEPDSGSDLTVNPINDIAHAVIELEEAEVEIILDDEMSDTSENAVQNKVVKAYVDEKADETMGYIDERMTDIENAYEAGRQFGIRSDVFDVALDYGNRKSCEYTFYYWNVEHIRPNFVFRPNTRTINCFGYNKALKKIEKQYFDFSGCVTDNTASSQGHYYTFAQCSALEEVEDIGLPAGYYYATWYGCANLHTIELVRCEKETLFTANAFSCNNLKNIKFDGEIGQSISFSSCGKLSVESVIDILQHLFNYNGTADAGTKTITFHDEVKTLMAQQGASSDLDNKTYDAYITDKGWNLA